MTKRIMDDGNKKCSRYWKQFIYREVNRNDITFSTPINISIGVLFCSYATISILSFNSDALGYFGKMEYLLQIQQISLPVK